MFAIHLSRDCLKLPALRQKERSQIYQESYQSLLLRAIEKESNAVDERKRVLVEPAGIILPRYKV